MSDLRNTSAELRPLYALADSTGAGMGTRLKRIVLKGFRSIREVDIAFSSINLLIGANGAGKSNFLGFFGFMRQVVQKGLQYYVVDRGGPDRLLHFGRKTTPALGYQIEFDGGSYEGRLLATTADQLRFVEERCRRTGGVAGDPGVVELGFGGGLESRIPSRPSDSLLGLIYSHIDSWRVYHFHDTTHTAGVKLQSNVADNVALHPDASNLAAFLLRIQGTANYELIVRTVRQVAPFFEGFVLEPEDSANRFVRLRWSHRGSDEGGAEFAAIVRRYSNPELINDGHDTAPSKRLDGIFTRHLKRRYKKVAFGRLIAGEIGLERMRERCPRFSSWLAGLQRLNE